MKETTYELRTLNEILQMIPDSHVSTDPIDSNMCVWGIAVTLMFTDCHVLVLTHISDIRFVSRFIMMVLR